LFENSEAHHNEHSIEVQLPFLQFINKERLNDIRIVAVMISSGNYAGVAERIHKVLQETGKKALFICSSGFTHYGINYGFMPFKDNVKDQLYEFDKKAISFVEKLDVLGFNGYVRETRATICGANNIGVLIDLMKRYGLLHGKLLRYYTSGDVTGDYSSAVGYGAIVFEKKD
jgi:AmmeMemoRadiSam system protein B